MAGRGKAGREDWRGGGSVGGLAGGGRKMTHASESEPSLIRACFIRLVDIKEMERKE